MIETVLRIKRAAWAILWTLVSGKPLSTRGTIAVRHSLCVNCPLQALKHGTFRSSCKECGCTINRNRNAFNKLAHPEESCPAGYWGPIVELDTEPKKSLTERILDACCRL